MTTRRPITSGRVGIGLRLPHVFLIFGVQAVIVAHRDSRRADGVVQFGPHIGHGLFHRRLESGVFHRTHPRISLAAHHATAPIEDAPSFYRALRIGHIPSWLVAFIFIGTLAAVISISKVGIAARPT